MTKFTIVTITYNAEAVIETTLRSVLRQDWPDVEHLIVDGASTDGTVKLARQYQQQTEEADCGHTVIVTSEPDRGLYDAMNKGLRQATGQYVVFLNAGDSLPDADTLSAIARAIDERCDSQDMPAVVYGDTHIVDAEGRFLGRRRLTPPERLTWRSFRSGMRVCHQAFYARTDIARAIPYDLQYRYSADVDWCIRVMKEAARRGVPLLNAHRVLALYLNEGETTRHHRESLRERFRVMRHHYGLAITLAMHIWFVVRQYLPAKA